MKSLKPVEKNYAVWVLVIALIFPMVFRNLSVSYEFQIVVHYLIYITGFWLASSLVFRKTNEQDGVVSALQLILIVTIFWDFAYPLEGVPAFSLLKVLFYLLTLIKFSDLLFLSSRFYKFNWNFQPLTFLVLAIAYNFYIVAYPSIWSVDFAGIPVLRAIVSLPFLSLVLLVSMLYIGVRVSITSIREPDYLRSITPIVLGLIFLLIGIVFCYNIWIEFFANSNVDSMMLYSDYGLESLPFSVSGIALIGLFLFCVTFALYDEAKYKKYLGVIFLSSFLLLYIGGNIYDIVAGSQELVEFQKELSLFWKIAEGVAAFLGFVASIYQLSESKQNLTPVKET